MNDLRLAFRRFAQTPGFTAVAVLVLALGIAGNTVVFSLVNGLFLKPLPFPHPEQLVDLDETAPKWNLRYTGINYADFDAWRRQNQTFAAMVHFRTGEFTLGVRHRIERVAGQRVTAGLDEVFGIRPVLGRMFRADEQFRNGPKVALIGHHLWQEWFAGDPAVVGQRITLDAETYVIIGVLPATAVVPTRTAVWIPFDAEPRNYGGLAIGRLKPGVTIEQATADLLRIHRARISEQKENEVTAPIVQPLLQRHLGDASFVGLVLQSAVVVLLLIAAANVAGLVLARTLGRAPELGLRAALGASRAQLARQLMLESLVLSLVGAAAGLLLGRWALDALLSVFPDLPAWINVEMDARFVAFLCGVVALCAVLAGLVPARHVLNRLEVRAVIGAGGSQVTTSRDRLLTLRILVVAEIALALTLLLVAALFGRAMLQVRQIDPGLRADHLLTYGVLLPEATYRSGPARLAFFEEHLARVRALPGVTSASVANLLPFSGQHIGNFFEPEGGPPATPGSASPVVLTCTTFPDYFATAGIPLLTGRSFGDRSRREIVVSEMLARLFWPGEHALGKRIRSRGGQGPWLEVVGVARDVRHYGLESEPRPTVYVPFYAMPQANAGVLVRTQGDPSALAPTIRALVKDQDAALPVAGLATMEESIRRSLFARRLYSSLTATFAAIALAIAMAGLYGIVAYVVGQRTREFGIRLALGAQLRDLAQLVVAEGARLAGIGIAFGLAGGALAGAALSGILAGVSPLDPVVLLGTSGLVGCVVLVACLVPARRALRLDAVEVLRSE